MPIIAITDAAEGMITSIPIKDPTSDKLLVAENTKLTEKTIAILERYGVVQIAVLEQFTLLINPNDTTKAETLHELRKLILKYAPHHPEANKNDAMVGVSKHIAGLLETVVDDELILDYLTTIKITSMPLLKHSYAVCSLSMLVAGAMGLDEVQVVDIGKAALIHDIGMLEMPFLIGSSNRGDQQEGLFREHTTYAYYMSKEAGLSDRIATILHTHHEKWNGSGYPQGLSEEMIYVGGRVLAVCDSFDTFVRFENMPHYHAIEYLYGGGGFFFDPKVTDAFLKNICIYPLGALVKLSTGESGVVVNVRRNLGDRPVVDIYYNSSDRKNSVSKQVDLGQQSTLFITKLFE